MTPRSLLLCVLVLLTLFSSASTPMLRENFSHIRDFYEANDHLDTALLDQSVEESFKSLLCAVWCSPLCNNQCCRFVEGFPVKLRKLRENFSHIRDFYEANDHLDTALLDQSVEESFKTTFACQAMNSILGFYLGTVLPTALADETEDTRNLKPHMQSIQQIFDQFKSDVHTCMKSKGLYKAMGELDLLFNYIETYLASKRRGTRVASA